MKLRKPKPKKRGSKPGVDNKPSDIKINWEALKEVPNLYPKYSPAPVWTLCGQLEDSVMLLENRISNVIAKINSLI